MAASRVKNSAINFHLTTFIPTSPKHDPAMSSTPIQPDGLTPSGVPIIQTQRHPLPRRRFLAAMGASAAVIALGGCTGDPQPHLLDRNENMAATPRPAGDTVPFIEPQALRSANGSLEVTLVALPATIADAEQTLYGYTYNQTSPGPTLRIRPGDQLIVHLENQLPEDTNLHTHGLHVSPEGNADNVFARVRPGETRTYTYNIPQDHRGGLFWYHPHAHGTVAKQVAAGLAGAIVIEDDTDAVTEIADSTERILIMSDPPAVSSLRAVVPSLQRGCQSIWRVEIVDHEEIKILPFFALVLDKLTYGIIDWNTPDTSPDEYRVSPSSRPDLALRRPQGRQALR